jgi:two-component sensor histidine kinase
MSLRSRLSVLVGLALLPPIALLGYDAVETRQRESQRVLDEARHQAQLVAGQLDAIIQGARRLSWALSHQTRVIQADARCPELMRAVVNDVPLFRAGIVTDRTGKVVCSWPPVAGADLGDRDYFRRAMQQPDMVVGTLILRGRVTGASALPMARRYSTEAGSDGVIILGLDLDLIARSFQERHDWSDRSMTVVDSAGMIVIRVPGQAEAAGRPAPKGLDRANLGSGSFEWTADSGRRALVGFARVEGLLVSVSIDNAAVLAQLDQATWRNALLMALALLLALAAAWVAGERLVRRPVRRLVKAARRQEAGEHDVRFPDLDATTELGVLSRALNRMAAANAQLLGQREILLRELQHRVMNSLQLLASFLQLQSRHADAGAREQLAVAHERIIAMSTIFRYLHRADLASSVEFGTFLEAFCRDTSRAYLGPDAPRLVVEADAKPLPLEQALALALMAHELITNAVKHAFATGAPGTIRVTFRALAGGASELEVADDGRGMPAGFDPAASKSLGMILVQRLSLSLGGTCAIKSGAHGTEITISLPASAGENRRDEAASGASAGND